MYYSIDTTHIQVEIFLGFLYQANKFQLDFMGKTCYNYYIERVENMIYEQLTQGTAIFKVQEDGTETVEHKPPTTLHLQAARMIKQQHDQLQQLGQAHIQLQQHYQQLVDDYNQLKQQHDQNITTPTTTSNDNSAGVEPSSA